MRLPIVDVQQHNCRCVPLRIDSSNISLDILPILLIDIGLISRSRARVLLRFVEVELPRSNQRAALRETRLRQRNRQARNHYGSQDTSCSTCVHGFLPLLRHLSSQERLSPRATQTERASHTTAGQSLVLLNGKIPHRKVPKRIIQRYEMALHYES